MQQKPRTVVVTGASSGIGQACAQSFARAGDRLVIVARRADQLEHLKHALAEAYNTETLLVTLDVRDRSAVESGLGLLPPEWRDVDVLVNSAGLAAGLAAFPDADLND